MTSLPRPTAAQIRTTKNRPASGAVTRIARLAGSAALLCALFILPGQALSAVTDDAVLKRMDSVLEENTRLRDEAWKSRKQGRDAAKQAEDALNASNDRLERTRTEALAHVAGVTPNQVESLRKDGKSWGQAAGELGVHPGFLGVGKAPLYQSLPPRKATAEAPKAKGKRGKKGQEPAQAQAAIKPGVQKKSKIKKEVKASAKATPTAAKKTKKTRKKD